MEEIKLEKSKDMQDENLENSKLEDNKGVVKSKEKKERIGVLNIYILLLIIQ